jgi:dTDP-glucose 4,6-dehydratase
MDMGDGLDLLVTGGLGFIGSNFILRILGERPQTKVTNIDDMRYGSNPKNLEGIPADRYTLIKGDIADYSLISSLVKGKDAVVNFAAETHVDRSLSNPGSFLQSNVIGAFALLEALRKKNPRARLVHVSTDEVYGDIAEGSFTEKDVLRPSSPYSASKASSDMFVLAYARTYGLQAMITRCTNNYGPRQFPEKLIPKSVLRANMSLKIPIYGRGTNVRDWIYVLDHCRAIESVMEAGEKGQIYNISSGDERSNLEVVGEILKIMGKGTDLLEFVEDRPGHDLRYSLDSSKILEDLGWKPIQTFKNGLKATVQWYLDNVDWWSPLINDDVLHPTPWKLKW